MVEAGDADRAIDLKLAYEVLSKTFPLQGKGTITIGGTQAARPWLSAFHSRPKNSRMRPKSSPPEIDNYGGDSVL